MKATHLVLRVLPGPEGDIYGGTLVDASAWGNCRLLESSGYIRPLTDEELADPALVGKPPAGSPGPSKVPKRGREPRDRKPAAAEPPPPPEAPAPQPSPAAAPQGPPPPALPKRAAKKTTAKRGAKKATAKKGAKKAR